MRTDYRIDDFQQTYFVIDSFEKLRHKTADVDFKPLYRGLENLSNIMPDTVLDSDRLLTRGTQAYFRKKARTCAREVWNTRLPKISE